MNMRSRIWRRFSKCPLIFRYSQH